MAGNQEDPFSVSYAKFTAGGEKTPEVQHILTHYLPLHIAPHN